MNKKKFVLVFIFLVIGLVAVYATTVEKDGVIIEYPWYSVGGDARAYITNTNSKMVTVYFTIYFEDGSKYSNWTVVGKETRSQMSIGDNVKKIVIDKVQR